MRTHIAVMSSDFLPLRRLSAAAVSSSASPCASPRQERMSFVIHSLPSAATPSDIMTTVSPSRSSAPAFEKPMRLSMPAGSDGSSSIAVRPERVQLAGEGEGTNRLDATVRELIYLGDQIRLRIELAGKHEFTIKAPVSQLDRSLRPGDAIRVGLDPAHTRALDVPAAH